MVLCERFVDDSHRAAVRKATNRTTMTVYLVGVGRPEFLAPGRRRLPRDVVTGPPAMYQKPECLLYTWLFDTWFLSRPEIVDFGV